ncbi:hypothetical protein JW992_15805 [candidate division KSB1 bacterium]|nr:hypothetical protein [candidate division KSB1 bacterium]
MILLSILAALAAAIYVLAPLFTEPVDLDIRFAAERQKLHLFTHSNEFAAGIMKNRKQAHPPAQIDIDRLLQERFDLNLKDLRNTFTPRRD